MNRNTNEHIWDGGRITELRTFKNDDGEEITFLESSSCSFARFLGLPTLGRCAIITKAPVHPGEWREHHRYIRLTERRNNHRP